MKMMFIQRYWVQIARSILLVMGAIWLPIEAYEGLSNDEAKIPFFTYLLVSVIFGYLLFLYDGHRISGFLKDSIDIKSTAFNSTVTLKFGDLFAEKGWKVIGVNDFFDSKVDDKIIAKNSLHGFIINNYWKDNKRDWESQIFDSVKSTSFIKEKRKNAHKHRYPIGTTAVATTNQQKFLCVAIGETDVESHMTTATSESLIKAVRGCLSKAREVCSNEPLCIPLIGSGLGRVNLIDNATVCLILTAIFEETKKEKITDHIIIVLAKDKRDEFDLPAIAKLWH